MNSINFRFFLFKFIIIYLYYFICSIATNNCSISDIVSNLNSSVVNISTTQFFEENNRLNNLGTPDDLFKFFDKNRANRNTSTKYSKIISLGSGFLIDNKGHIVTNNHVVENSSEINITIGNNNKIYKATILGTDKKTDIALLKINMGNDFSFVKFGNSDNARVGDYIIAIGNAFGFGGTVTSGIISATNRHLGGHFYEDFIQTDASINKGNSGGPMFNIYGEVIGMNSAIISPTGGNVGVGFAIPSNVVRSIVSKLLIEGKIYRPWLGITFQYITTDISKTLNMDSSCGVIVSNVTKNSPAFRSGIMVGDVILKFNNLLLDESVYFPKIIFNSAINVNIPIEIFRKGNIITSSIKLENPDNEHIITNRDFFINQKSYLGISIIDINSKIKKKYSLPENISGIYVTSVDISCDAYKKGLRVGDIIICINQEHIYSSQQFVSIINNIKESNSKKISNAIFLVSRNHNYFYVTIDLN